MRRFGAAERHVRDVILAQGSHSNDPTGAAGEMQPCFVTLFSSLFNETSRGLTAAARAALRREEHEVAGAQPPLGAGNQDLRNELSRSRLSRGQVSNAIADGIAIEEDEPAAVNPPPRQGRASSRGSGRGRTRNRNRRDAEDAVLIGERTRGFESQLASFTGILQDLSSSIREPVQTLQPFSEVVGAFERTNALLQSATEQQDDNAIAFYTVALNGISLEMQEREMQARTRLHAPVPAPPASLHHESRQEE